MICLNVNPMVTIGTRTTFRLAILGARHMKKHRNYCKAVRNIFLPFS